jgi:N-methylhydantoinase A
VLVNARVAVSGVLDDLPQEPLLPAAESAAPGTGRAIYLDGGWTKASVYAFEGLAPGQIIRGPAIVESAMTTILLRRGDTAATTPHGWFDIEIA